MHREMGRKCNTSNLPHLRLAALQPGLDEEVVQAAHEVHRHHVLALPDDQPHLQQQADRTTPRPQETSHNTTRHDINEMNKEKGEASDIGVR